MNNIVFVNFECNESTKVVAQKIWQYDYGQILRIQGLELPAAVEIHFSLQKTGGIAERRIGVTKDGVTDVIIPDFILKGGGIERDYYAYAFIYLSNEESGQTEHRIELSIISRPEPEGSSKEDDTSFGAIMDAVNKIAEQNGQGVSDEKIAEAVNTYMEENPVEGANVTAEKISEVLGYTPAKETDVSQLSDTIANLKENGVSGGSGGSTGDSGSTNPNFDTEVSIPYTPTTDTQVKMIFETATIQSYDVDIARNGQVVDDYTITPYGALTTNTKENVIVDDTPCVKFVATADTTTPYQQIFTYADTPPTNENDYYFCYIKLKVESTYNSTNTQVLMNPSQETTWNGEVLNNHSKVKNKFSANSTNWQEVFSIGKYPNYNLTNKMTLRVFNAGIVYIAKMYQVNLTTNGLETKTIDELIEMAQNDSFEGMSNAEFSCIVSNGGVNETITPFSEGSITSYYTVSANTTLEILENSGYKMPTITVLIPSNNADYTNDDYVLTTRFKGCTVVFEGDSITDSDYLEAYNGKSWANYLNDIIRFGNVINPAIGGSSISTYNSAGSVVNRIANTNYPSDTKLFFVFAGTNDWNSNVSLGDVDSTDTSTILGALNTIIDTIQTKLPECTIVVMTPMHRSGMRTATRTAGTLSELAKAYENVCERWGVDCVNTLRTFGINAYNTNVASKYFAETDGQLHPSIEGHKRIARRMAGYLNQLQ